MENIYLMNNEGTPQYGCSVCSKCSSVFGKSLCQVKNRGCCWYYPKFTLYEIHKMVKSKEGLSTLNEIVKMNNTVIYNYYIHAKGFFDEESYNKYLKDRTSALKFATEEEIKEVNDEILHEEEEFLIYEDYEEHDMTEIKHIKKPRIIKDVSMFFRACPFIEPGKGCTLNQKYRSFICNFFICDEISDKMNDNEEFQKYIEERDNYIRWIQWENNSVQALLRERNLNLINNFNEIIDILKDLDLEEYNFPQLKEIKIESNNVLLPI